VPDQITVHDSTAAIPARQWNALLPGSGGRPDNPFMSHAFFLALEESGCATPATGWRPRHLTLAGPDGEPAALMPLFQKSHSMGEYVFDHGWAEAFQRAGGRYYPKLQCAVPFTPVTGPRLLARDDAGRRALLRAAQQLTGRGGASSVHATFVPEDEAALAEAAGWLVRHDTQYHWRNHGFHTFEDFLATLSSRKRKTIRHERKEAMAGLAIEWLAGSELRERHWDAFFTFYEDTGSRKWGRPYLNRAFFSRLTDTMADDVVLMLARDGDEYIAGALNLRGRDRLYGRYWGASRHVPFLHFELCYYQAIDYAIAHGLSVVEAGAQGEHKLARGYEPTTTRSVHWIADAGFRDAVADYLERERGAVAREQEALYDLTPFRKDSGG
jgi:predicted N-acyltransferase